MSKQHPQDRPRTDRPDTTGPSANHTARIRSGIKAGNGVSEVNWS